MLSAWISDCLGTHPIHAVTDSSKFFKSGLPCPNSNKVRKICLDVYLVIGIVVMAQPATPVTNELYGERCLDLDLLRNPRFGLLFHFLIMGIDLRFLGQERNEHIWHGDWIFTFQRRRLDILAVSSQASGHCWQLNSWIGNCLLMKGLRATMRTEVKVLSAIHIIDW